MRSRSELKAHGSRECYVMCRGRQQREAVSVRSMQCDVHFAHPSFVLTFTSVCPRFLGQILLLHFSLWCTLLSWPSEIVHIGDIFKTFDKARQMRLSTHHRKGEDPRVFIVDR
jgi:hypothetical protein